MITLHACMRFVLEVKISGSFRSIKRMHAFYDCYYDMWVIGSDFQTFIRRNGLSQHYATSVLNSRYISAAFSSSLSLQRR